MKYQLNEITITGCSEFAIFINEIKKNYNIDININGDCWGNYYHLNPIKGLTYDVYLDYDRSQRKNLITYQEFNENYKEEFLNKIHSLLNISQTYSII
jgi:hypothetical protein